MCTVSLIAWGDAVGASVSARGMRVVCNRDESRMRPAARPPEIRRCGDFKTIMPVDPLSDGTWIAVNEAGLVATLLNIYQRPVSESSARDKLGFRSRGTIVPAMMAHADAREAALLFEQLDPRLFPPFKLIAVDGDYLNEFTSDGCKIHRAGFSWDGRSLLYTTSSLGDEVVYSPRRELFDQLFADASDLCAAQDCFHRHQWPDRPHVSVCMERADARTVSRTIVEVGSRTVSLGYEPVPPEKANSEPGRTLPRTRRM